MTDECDRYFFVVNNLAQVSTYTEIASVSVQFYRRDIVYEIQNCARIDGRFDFLKRISALLRPN